LEQAWRDSWRPAAALGVEVGEESIYGLEIAYLMERTGESWRVLGYVSARDQEEEMRALDLF
jgi:hypothetical protein